MNFLIAKDPITEPSLPTVLAQLTQSYLTPGERWYLGLGENTSITKLSISTVASYLEDLTQAGHRRIIKPLLTLFETKHSLTDLVQVASRERKDKIVDFITTREKYQSSPVLNAALYGVVQGNHIDRVKKILRHKLTTDLNGAAQYAAVADASGILAYLRKISPGPFGYWSKYIPIDWHNIFLTAVNQQSIKAMTVIPVELPTLLEAVQSSSVRSSPVVNHWFRVTLDREPGDLLSAVEDPKIPLWKIQNLLLLIVGYDAEEAAQVALKVGNPEGASYLTEMSKIGGYMAIRDYLLK